MKLIGDFVVAFLFAHVRDVHNAVGYLEITAKQMRPE